MKDTKALLISTALGFIFSLLFYNESLGINLAYFEIICFIALLFTKTLDFSNDLFKYSIIAQAITLCSIIYNYSIISILVHALFVILSIGILVYPSVKNVFYGMLMSVYSMICTPFKYLYNLYSSLNYKNFSSKSIWKYKLYILPLIVIIVFINIYKNASPQFLALIKPIEDFIRRFIPNVWEYINIDYISVLIIGIIGSSFLFMKTAQSDLIDIEDKSTEHIIRTKNKQKTNAGILSLNRELKTGVFLLIVLNLLILIVNVFDIYWVWFNFQWNGEYLKQFVHEGTYLLIFSILLSAAIVLYYFRKNQNFLQKSNFLKLLCYIWIAQNIVLSISVAIRNYWYIDYFNLAYKRIGVFVFLILVIYGLYTIFLKVKYRRSNYYLIRKNSLALSVLLLVTSLFNWDIIITKYNFKHADHAFIHFDYLVDMSPKALPYMNFSLEELKRIEAKQTKLFKDREHYMKAEDFYLIVQNHKRVFIAEYAKAGKLSWNFSDQKTIRKLLIAM